MGKKFNILLGITGGIAAYKSAEIVRLLTKKNHQVRVVMTRTAEDFITPLTFETLTGNKVYQYNTVEKNKPMLHIDLAKWADIILVAPTTAEFLSKILHGRADDILTTTCLACNKKIILAPSMNKNMWQNEATQENYKTLKKRGIYFSGPEYGSQACGDIGSGRMKEPKDIVEDLEILLENRSDLFKNKKIVITAGPTVENIDPVRYISNRSSGMMGCEIANAFYNQGAEVFLVKGPCNYKQHDEINSINVISAEDMLNSVEKNIKNCDIFISAAAVSDFIPKTLSENKIKKEDTLNIELKHNVDILKTISEKYNVFSIGFAAETEDLKTNAIKKLKNKKISVIAANKVSFSEGIDSVDNSITLYWGNGMEKTLDLKNKKDLAIEFVEEISNIYN